MTTPLETLRKYWNYDSFKVSQERIIAAILEDKDVIAILPTGGGKSLCYQVPALVKEGVCVVISPLIALMNDQVGALKNRGIKAIAITSELRQEEIITAFDNLLFGNFKFLYLSPEKLQSTFIQQKIKQLNINLIAIDEAHCISEWGHDFRPAYLKIPVLKEIHPNVPMVGLTATATKIVLKDIVGQLKIPQCTVIRRSLVRHNLAVKVIENEDVYYHIQRILKRSKLPAILYANSRKKVKDISDYLNRNDFRSSFYHGGLSHEEKSLSFKRWMLEKTPIMVATNAFGMGIDKDNVENIIHIDLPGSLENYMQEAGRAGRNGKAASSYIFGNKHSISNLKGQFQKGLVSVEFAKTVYKNLNQYFHVAYGDIIETCFEFNLAEFCAQYNTKLLQTYNAIKCLEREDILFLNENRTKKSRLKFTASHHQVLDYSEKNNSVIVPLLLRSYGGIFEHYININEVVLAKKLGVTQANIKKQLIRLSDDNIIAYEHSINNSQLQFLVPREDDLTINRVASELKRQNSIKLEKMNAMINYVENKSVCRSKHLLSYFDETGGENCGFCDVCLKNMNKVFIDPHGLSEKILELFATSQQLSIQEVIMRLNQEESDILSALQLLLDSDKINITSQNKLEKVLND